MSKSSGTSAKAETVEIASDALSKRPWEREHATWKAGRKWYDDDDHRAKASGELRPKVMKPVKSPVRKPVERLKSPISTSESEVRSFCSFHF